MTDQLESLSRWQRIFGLLYLLVAGLAAWQTICHTNAATGYFDQICEKQNLNNEGAQVVAQFVTKHKILGSFVASYLQKNLHVPTLQESSDALGQIPLLKPLEEQEEGLAAHWSWLLLSLSLVYLVITALHHPSDRTRNVLFALSGISAVFFSVGIAASVMTVFTTINNFYGVTPIVQHEVRSLISVITGLFSTGHWIFAAFITLFSVITPSFKITLTLFAAITSSLPLRQKISKFLDLIDKWSMTDVFVAAVILACFTIESGKATQVIPCRGLFYFAAYALLSMITTSLLAKLNSNKEAGMPDPWSQLKIPFLGKLLGVVLFLSAVSALKK